jgi:hypothetical protein
MGRRRLAAEPKSAPLTRPATPYRAQPKVDMTRPCTPVRDVESIPTSRYPQRKTLPGQPQ